MAVESGTVVSYANEANREDLVDQIFMVSPYETPWLARMDSSAAYATSHDWPVDKLEAPASDNATLEGDDAGTVTGEVPNRPTNFTQQFEKVRKVSTIQQAVDKPGRQDDLNYQLWKGSLSILTDVETTFFANQAKRADNGTLAGLLAGAQSWLYTTVDGGATSTEVDYSGVGYANGTLTRTPGTPRALTEDMARAAVAAIYDAGGNPSSWYTSMTIKSGISKYFEGIATKYQNLDDRQIQAGVDIYDSEAGRVEIVPCRHTGGSSLFMMQDDMWARSDLIPLNSQPLAKTGHADKEMLEIVTTLEARNEESSGAIYDITAPTA